MNIFNIINAPLNGVNLIEASAGTGKTYAIEGLYIRLLLEKKLTLDQILVVTFTRAATEELKSRIRQKLTIAKATLDGTKTQDPFIQALCDRTKNHPDASQRLQNAILNFDQSAIYTIHGFCQRILAESAFETCNLFDFEVITDLSGLLYEIVDDFWRNYFYQAPIEVVSHAISQLSSPEYFYGLSAKAARHNLQVLPSLDRPALNTIQDYRSLVQELSKAWKADKQILLKLLKDPSLNGNIYGSLKSDANYPGLSKRDVAALRLGKSMDRFIAEKCQKFPPFKRFELFTRTKLMQSVKKNHEPPRHPFFDLCDTLHKKSGVLEAEMNNFLVYLKSEFFKYMEAALSHKKKTIQSNRFRRSAPYGQAGFRSSGGYGFIKENPENLQSGISG